MKNKIIPSLFLIVVTTSLCFAVGERYWIKATPPIGTYGLTYNPVNNRLYYLNFYLKQIYIVSSDSFLTSYGTIPCPNNDSACTDIKYCSYDNTFWVLNNWRKRVYKINTSGTVLRYFNITSMDYPVGLAWDGLNRQLYISDRRTSGGQTQYIYCVDTMGNVIRQMVHPYQGAWYGTRCLDYVQAQGSVPAHLLNVYTFFNSSSTIDSTGVYKLNPQNCQILDFFRYCHPSNDSSNIRGVAVDPRDGSYWIGLFQYGT